MELKQTSSLFIVSPGCWLRMSGSRGLAAMPSSCMAWCSMDVTVCEKWMAGRGKQGVYHLYGGCDNRRFGMCKSDLCQDYEGAGFLNRDWIDWKKRRGLGKSDIIYVKNFASMSAEQEVKESENTRKSTEVQKLNSKKCKILTIRSIKSKLQEVQKPNLQKFRI